MLFEPIRVGQIELRNRIVMPPMVSNMGIVSKQGRCWYRERALGDVGFVIVEATWLQRFHDPDFVRGLPALVDAVKSAGAAIAIQLFQPAELDGHPVAVSEEAGRREPSAGEIRRLVAEYAHAARVCVEAGFDGVEPHGAHGFLLNQFLSPRTNRRTDEYGGNIQGRMRFGLQVAACVREAIGPRHLLLYRHTPQEDAPGGYTLDDTLTFARDLVQVGVDVLDISPSSSGRGLHCDLAHAVKKAVSVPVIAVGGMRYAGRAVAALREGKCDLVAVGRQLIGDAHWPDKVRQGRINEIVECRECDSNCFGGLRRGVPIGCVNNPDSGREYLRYPDS